MYMQSVRKLNITRGKKAKFAGEDYVLWSQAFQVSSAHIDTSPTDPPIDLGQVSKLNLLRKPTWYDKKLQESKVGGLLYS